MKIRLGVIIAAFVLLSALGARAQNFTNVTGTVVDPNGIPYSNAIITGALVPGTSGPWRLGGFPYAGTVGPAQLNTNGTFNITVGSNAAILPAGTQWVFSVTLAGGIPPPLGTGSQQFTTAPITISGGSTVNISSTLNALAPKLTNFASAGSVSLTATSPIVVTPSPIIGTGVISCPTCGGVPGGSPTQLQYNNLGMFGGVAGSSVTANGAISLAGTLDNQVTLTGSSTNLTSAATENDGVRGIVSMTSGSGFGAAVHGIATTTQTGTTASTGVSAVFGLSNYNPPMGGTLNDPQANGWFVSEIGGLGISTEVRNVWSDTTISSGATATSVMGYWSRILNLGTDHNAYDYYAFSLIGVADTLNVAYFAEDQGAGNYAFKSGTGRVSIGGTLDFGNAAPFVTAFQGTDTKALTSGTISGTSAMLCTDANGGATTSGCSGSATFGIVGAGDSRMIGVTGTPAGYDLLTQLSLQGNFLGVGAFHNGAVSGDTCANMTSRYASNVQPYKPAGSITRVFLFILVGINDFTAGNTADYEQQCMGAYLNQSVADGFTPEILAPYYAQALTDAQWQQMQKYLFWLRSPVNPYLTIDLNELIPPGSEFTFYGVPSGSAVNVTAYSISTGIGIQSYAVGSGYSGAATCSVSGGTSSTAATCSATVVSGGIVPTMTNPGVYSSTAGVTIAVSASGGSSATVTPYAAQAATFTATNSLSAGNTVFLSGFGTSIFLNGSTSADSPNGLNVVKATGSNFITYINHASTSATEAGIATLIVADGTHLSPAATVLEAAFVNFKFGLLASGTTAPVYSQVQNYIAPTSQFYRIVGNINAGASTNFGLTGSVTGGSVAAAIDATDGYYFLGSDTTDYIRRQGNVTSFTGPSGGYYVFKLPMMIQGGSLAACPNSTCTFDTNGYIESYVSMTAGRFKAGYDGLFYIDRNGNTVTINSPGTISENNAYSATAYLTATNCLNLATPAVCGSAAAGTVQVPATGTSLVVATTAAAGNFEVQFVYDTWKAGCTTAPANIASLITPYVSASSTGVSFTLTLPVAPITNPVCIDYWIVNSGN